MNSLANLIDGSVDYAGLFPPAGLPMDDVVGNFANYLKSNEQAMLGRLIVPAMKLPQMNDAAAGHWASRPTSTAAQQASWKISALVPPIDDQSPELQFDDFDRAIDSIKAFNDQHLTCPHGSAIVDSVELKTTSVRTTLATIKRLPADIKAFLEISWHSDPDPIIRCIAEHPNGKQVFAKIRTGGVTPELIPSSHEIARFIASCAKHHAGFKATAGLHHPIRAEHRLTYEPDAPAAVMHGFLNVFVASVIAFEHQISQALLVEILNNTQPEAFQFEQNSLTWGEFTVSSERIAEIRNTGITSFGSCSFVEPTQELVQLPGTPYASAFTG